MKLENEDVRIAVLQSGLTYKEIAGKMNISRFWLSRAMAKKLSPDMRVRILAAINELKQESQSA